MVHRREPAEPTKVMKPVKVKKTSLAQRPISNWWYVVGFLGGTIITAVWWLYLYNPIMSIFY